MICGVDQRSFTWDDNWGKATNKNDMFHMARVAHGHLGPGTLINHPVIISLNPEDCRRGIRNCLDQGLQHRVQLCDPRVDLNPGVVPPKGDPWV